MMIKMANTRKTRKVSREPESLRAGKEARGRVRGELNEVSQQEGKRREVEKTLRKSEVEFRRKERPKLTARQAQAPRASPENRAHPVQRKQKTRCSRGQSCPHCGHYVEFVNTQTDLHYDGSDSCLNDRRPTRFHVERQRPRMDSRMEQRQPSSPLNFLAAAKRGLKTTANFQRPQAYSPPQLPRAKGVAQRQPPWRRRRRRQQQQQQQQWQSVPYLSAHSRGAFQPPTASGGRRRRRRRNSTGRLPPSYQSNSTPPAPHGRTCVIERGNGGHAVRAAFPRAGDVPVSPPGRRAAPCPSSVIGVVRRPPVGKRDWVVKGDHANHTVQNKNRPPNPMKMELDGIPATCQVMEMRGLKGRRNQMEWKQRPPAPPEESPQHSDPQLTNCETE